MEDYGWLYHFQRPTLQLQVLQGGNSPRDAEYKEAHHHFPSMQGCMSPLHVTFNAWPDPEPVGALAPTGSGLKPFDKTYIAYVG